MLLIEPVPLTSSAHVFQLTRQEEESTIVQDQLHTEIMRFQIDIKALKENKSAEVEKVSLMRKAQLKPTQLMQSLNQAGWPNELSVRLQFW